MVSNGTSRSRLRSYAARHLALSPTRETLLWCQLLTDRRVAWERGLDDRHGFDSVAAPCARCRPRCPDAPFDHLGPLDPGARAGATRAAPLLGELVPAKVEVSQEGDLGPVMDHLV